MTHQDSSGQNLPGHEGQLIFTYSGPPIRLDHFLHRKFPDISIKKWKQAIGTSVVLVNQRSGRKGTILTKTSCISLPARLPSALASGPPKPDPTITLAVIFEDDELLVIDKPTGIHTHPLSPDETGTLANGLINFYPALERVGFSPLQPGLLNRLDRDTSGLVLVAKSQKSWEKYRQFFKTRQLTKIYLGIVHGVLTEPLTIDQPLIHQPGSPGKMTTRIPDNFRGRQLPATTFIKPLRHEETSTRVQLTMNTGVMHQLRVHAADAGYPLVGDLVYGNPETKSTDAKTGRLLLHAFQLQIPDGRQFTAPIDWDKVS